MKRDPVSVFARTGLTAPPSKRSKYNAKRTEAFGISFASRREANRYCQLRLLERAGEIHDLQLQPRYPLIVNGVKVATYVADFRYLTKGGKLVIEDAKGVRTDVYRIKRALFEALHPGTTITEV